MADDITPSEEKCLEVLLGSEEIAKAVAELGGELSRLYQGESVVVIPLLKGGFMFAADLIRCKAN